MGTVADPTVNPYASEDVIGPYQGPNPDYAVPEHDDHYFLDEPSGSGPKTYRITEHGPLQKEPVDFAADPHKTPKRFFDFLRGKDVLDRHNAQEDQDGDGWTIQKDGSSKRAAADPRRTPPPESRPTQEMSPVGYSFTRPFDQHSARQFNGVRFSMADHRRDYEILGMAPPRTGRNTFRIEPKPWDTNIVDVPPDVTPNQLGNARIHAIDIPPTLNRSWRL